MSVLVSIVIAAYNVEDYIEACLDSCVHQSYPDIEIIIIDDGSIDRTSKIADQYAQKDSRIVCVHQENGGLVRARKSGLEHSTGEYIFFLDGDDTLPLKAIDVLVRKMRDQVDIVCGSLCIIDPDGGRKNRDIRFDALSGVEFIDFFLTKSFCNIVGNLYRRHIFENVEWPVQLYKSIGEDLVTLVQVSYLSRQVDCAESVTYNYHRRETSIIGEAKKIGIWGAGFGAYLCCGDFLKSYGILNKVRSGFLKLTTTFVLGYLNSRVPLKEYKQELKSAVRYAIGHREDLKKVTTSKQRLLYYLAGTCLYGARWVLRLNSVRREGLRL